MRWNIPIPTMAFILGILGVLAVPIALAILVVPTHTRTAQQEAQEILDRQTHVDAVQTMTNLLKKQQVVEAQGTQAAAAATHTVEALPPRATATAMAEKAAAQALSTRAAVMATATVSAAQKAADAEATAVVAAAIAVQHVAATQTASAIAAPLANWRARRDAAALRVSTCAEAAEIASSTKSVPDARSMAGQNQYFNPRPVMVCKD